MMDRLFRLFPFFMTFLFGYIKRSYSLSKTAGKSKINWYPGHIAKAERMLLETLRSVDVVIELRDGRCPKASTHPRVFEFCAGAARVIVINKLDLVPKPAMNMWRRSFGQFDENDLEEMDKQLRNEALQRMQNRESDSKEKKVFLWADARHGIGIHAIKRAVIEAGAFVNIKRGKQGLQPRALRVGVIGCPNVGKSALINKLLGRNRAKAADKPGVTRSLQWIKVRIAKNSASGAAVLPSIHKSFDLLDSPGIIPPNHESESDALLLAACNCIGDAAYDNQNVAAYLCDWMRALYSLNKLDLMCPSYRKTAIKRYKLDPFSPEVLSGVDFVFAVADNTCLGDPENAARKILQDFRNGRWGPVILELPPDTDEIDELNNIPRTIDRFDEPFSGYDISEINKENFLINRAEKARDLAKETGVDLPPILEKDDDQQPQEIGKGLFDGW